MSRRLGRPLLLAALLAGPAAAEPGWEAAAALVAPALRACLAGDKAAFVDDVGPASNGRLAIRVRRGAVTERCIASEAGQVAMRLPLPGAPPPEAAATAYFLERRCADARRVAAPGGTVLGWLAYPAC
ncbi:MAG: hypothetical protein JWP04_2647 [Belnapia sp.]|nr:hypothetical protein [Belnapia sp.]